MNLRFKKSSFRYLASLGWHESVPQSEYVEFEDVGHIVNMDTPEQFNKVLKKVIR